MTVPVFSRPALRRVGAASPWRCAALGSALCGLAALALLGWDSLWVPSSEGRVVVKPRLAAWPPAEVPGARRDDPPALHGLASAPAIAPDQAALAASFGGDDAAQAGKDPLQLNRDIPVQLLTQSRPLAAQSFLRHVVLRAVARGGYVVRHVAPGSAWDRMGLQTGDRIYSLDTPAMAAVDESSMVALIQASVLELDIVRNGMPMRLSLALNEEVAADDGPR